MPVVLSLVFRAHRLGDLGGVRHGASDSERRLALTAIGLSWTVFAWWMAIAEVIRSWVSSWLRDRASDPTGCLNQYSFGWRPAIRIRPLSLKSRPPPAAPSIAGL